MLPLLPIHEHIGLSQQLMTFRILNLMNMQKLSLLKEHWWNQNPFKQNCDNYNDDGVISANDTGEQSKGACHIVTTKHHIWHVKIIKM